MKRILSLLAVMVVMVGCIKDDTTGARLEQGDVMPDFEVIMSDGTILTDEMLKETVSVIMFFHTGCSDCRQVLPQMQKIYEEFASENIKFALISREESELSIDTFWTKNSLKMPYSAQNTRNVYKLFASEGIPRVYICEKGGTIRYIHTDNPVPSYNDIKVSLESLIR